MEVNSMEKIYARNGRICRKTDLHLKSAIAGFNYRNLAKRIALDLLKKQIQ